MKKIRVNPLLQNKNPRQSVSIKAFTIIEMLVVVGVIGLLSAILLVYSRSGERQIIIFREQARVINALSRAKSLSIATFGDAKSPCGWGVHFKAPATMIIFKELPSDPDTGCVSMDGVYTAGNPNEKFEEIKLDDKAIKFSELQLSNILFIPPNPLVVIDNDLSKTEVLIKIKTIDNQSERVIKVTNAGQITTY